MSKEDKEIIRKNSIGNIINSRITGGINQIIIENTHIDKHSIEIIKKFIVLQRESWIVKQKRNLWVRYLLFYIFIISFNGYVSLMREYPDINVDKNCFINDEIKNYQHDPMVTFFMYRIFYPFAFFLILFKVVFHIHWLNIIDTVKRNSLKKFPDVIER